MKYFSGLLFLGLAAGEQCVAPTDNCGFVGLPPNSNATMDARLFSEKDFKGTMTTVTVNGLYGCTNDVPSYKIKSLLSTGSTKVTLHYGKDCAGHVLQDYQGGSGDIDTKDCPGSIFIKFHRYGSC